MRTAVVGVGYLGRFHAQKYASLANSQLVGVADPSASARSAVAAEFGIPAHADYRELLGHVDAVSIVTPTPLHHEVAKDFLEAGAHVLVEKPMTVTIAEGESLIESARRAKRILQVGHLERFNAAVQAVQPTLERAALHRIGTARALQTSRHRGGRGARFDDPRHRFDSEHRALAGGQRWMRSAAVSFPRRSTSPMRACDSPTAASPMPPRAGSA